MPELPEVETICRGLNPLVTGQTVSQVIVRQNKLRWAVPENLAQILKGLRFDAVSRRAKYLLFTTNEGTLIVHLGMSGSLRFLTHADVPGKHDHIDIIFNDYSLLRFNDPRRFGAVLWTKNPALEHPLLKDLGPEPLSEAFSGEFLYLKAKNRKVPIKTFIMNSHIVVGVGNIYANEALFRAGISPVQKAEQVSLEQYQKLADCIRVVLQQAINQGGTTLRNFVNEAGKPGYFAQQLQVYGRSGQACNLCGQLLTEIRLANRSTVFCANCQHCSTS